MKMTLNPAWAAVGAVPFRRTRAVNAKRTWQNWDTLASGETTVVSSVPRPFLTVFGRSLMAGKLFSINLLPPTEAGTQMKVPDLR